MLAKKLIILEIKEHKTENARPTVCTGESILFSCFSRPTSKSFNVM